ncbi:pilus assembly protein TadG-related protein [Sphingorhabdus sp.]|uniref:pilus assembly protein TadG-related protein n=1 Tax=Sphingorhabdus sp. TaxID=1902408 RepID=UPI0039839FD8
MLRFIWRLKKDESAAVAATVALSLFGLIAVGGIAFDYARMVTLDTELQNAADQAALAGVTQLDGLSGARARATTAAQTLVANKTRLSNDGGGSAVVVPTASISFFTDTGAAGTDTTATRVKVSVTPRSVNYALTPITGLLSSPNLGASALAGIQSAVCNVPPLYMAIDPTAEARPLNPGVGVLLLNEEGSSRFGYLDAGGGGSDLKAALAWNDQTGLCQRVGGVTVKSGVNASVEKGFNTRFQTGNDQKDCPNGGGTCTPALNITEYEMDTCHLNAPISPCTQKIGDGVWVGQMGGRSRYQTYKDAIGSNYNFGSDRRRLTVALIPFGTVSNTTPVTPTKWVDVFIVRAMEGNGNKMRLYVEIIGDSSSATSGRRDVPYLIE